MASRFRQQSRRRFEHTQALVADGLTPTLYGAAFRAGPFTAHSGHHDARTRNRWSVVAVKSSFCRHRQNRRIRRDLAYTVLGS
jgi:hypothetical protein